MHWMITGMVIGLVWCLPWMDSTREVARGDGGDVATCDCIEINHVYDEDGKHRFGQVIFWRFDFRHDDYTVADWCLIEKLQGMDCMGDWWQAKYVDAKGKTRVVRSQVVARCDTQFDRERWNLAMCKECDRLKLFE